MKKIIVLLLVAVMCLSLVACGDGSGNAETPTGGENTNNQSGDNNGNNLEKIERGTVTTSENPLLPILFKKLADEGWSYTFNEDGTCSDTEYWWIESDAENFMTIKISTEYKWVYSIEIGYDSYFERVYINCYIPDTFVWAYKYNFYCPELNPLYQQTIDIICREWKGVDKSGVFYEDGTCTINGESYTWEFDTINKDDSYVDIDGRIVLAVITLYIPEGRNTLCLYQHKEGYYEFANMYYAELFEKVDLTLENFKDY